MKIEPMTTITYDTTKLLVKLHDYKKPDLSQIKIVEGIVLGERAIKEKCVMKHSQAKERLCKWLPINSAAELKKSHK